jgi:peroxiredoxin
MLEQQQLLPTQYLYWYAPLRKLLSDMPQSIQRYTERIPEHTAQFSQIDFTHPNFKTSGIFNELITGYYVLLENMSQSQTVVCTAMNTATSSLMAKLKTDEYLLNLVAEELFRFFEQRSLFQPAAHLAELLLNTPSYHSLLQEKLQQELQKYLALKVGNTAPDIFLSEGKKLSDLNQQVLLVFGASDCPACKEEALQLVQYTNLWKEKQRPISVVYISLDTDKERFNAAFTAAPFERYCDYKGWDSEAAKAYYVSATPSYFLLDKDLKIELQPTSVAHANEWMQAKR